MAAHYSAAVLPGRGRHPRDKASVENMASHVATWVIAGLRHERFTSLARLRARIREQIDAHNRQPFQKREGSRLSVFTRPDGLGHGDGDRPDLRSRLHRGGRDRPGVGSAAPLASFLPGPGRSNLRDGAAGADPLPARYAHPRPTLDTEQDKTGHVPEEPEGDGGG